MSWFNTSGFASLAKNALSQAQKTIDRALDIHDGGEGHRLHATTKKATAEEADFFAAFGLEDSNKTSSQPATKTIAPPSNQENVNSGTIWGSFSGSFFDSGTVSSDIKPNPSGNLQISQKTIASQPKASSSSSLPTNSVCNKLSSSTETSVSDTNRQNLSEGKSNKSNVPASDEFSSISSKVDDRKISNIDENMENFLQRTSKNESEKSATTIELVSSDSELVEIPLNSEFDNPLNRIEDLHDSHKLESSLLTESFLNVSPDSPREKSESEEKLLLQPEEKSSGESVIVLSDNPCSVSASCEFLIIDNTPTGTTEKGSSKPEKLNEAVLLEFDSAESLEKSTDSSETLKDSIDAEDIPTDQAEAKPVTAKIQKEWGWGWESGLSASMTKSEFDGTNNSEKQSVQLVGDTEVQVNQPESDSVSETNSQDARDQRKDDDHSISHNTLPKNDSFNSDSSAENDFSKASQIAADRSSSSNSENENQRDLEDTKELKEVKDSESKSTDSVISISSSSSSFVKCMIEEAIGDDAPRSHSPHSTTSSSEKSDMVKMESEQNSGHTSGDEVETTTSSDIEIISSPNTEMLDRLSLSPVKQIWPVKTSQAMRFRRAESPASDTSSARESPMAKRPRAEDHTSDGKHNKQRFTAPKTTNIHQRKPSEASSEELDNSAMDTDTLHKKIAEMTEVLKARESKLLELSHENISLQETKENLMSQLHHAEEKYAADSRDVTTLTEELSHRLATMERNLQQALREKETLQKELQQAKEDMANKVCAKQVEETIKEKDTQIQELLQEGEKLSKQQLQQSNIIKKLRVKEKETENLIKQQKEKLEEQSKELERARKSVSAKEDIERKQIDAIRQLTNTVQKQEKELSILRSDLEDALEKEKSMKAALDNSYKEIAELHRANAEKESKVQEAALSAEMVAKEELRDTLEKFRRDAQLEQERLAAQIEDYQISLSRTETIASRREEALKQEIADLQQRLQEAETRNQELTQSVSSATRPLLRQIENLQTTFSGQAAAWEKLEKHLTDRLTEAQTQLTNATEKERSTMEKYIETSSRISSLEAQNSALRQEKTRLQAQLESVQAKIELLEDNKTKESVHLENLKESFAEEIKNLKREKQVLEHQLEIEKTVVEAEKRKVHILQDQLKEKERKLSQVPIDLSNRNSPSPTLSISRFSSVSESFNPWIQDDLLEQSVLLSSTNGSRLNLYDSIKQCGATSVLEGLHSQLKMREGEISQLQTEIGKLERIRESMTQELVKAIGESDEINEEVKRLRNVKSEYEDMQQKYNALLQMYGEKVEEAEELKLDLLDIKEMYKAQIDGLLQR